MADTTALNTLTATEIAHKIARGETSAQAVTWACLERIAAREADVGAWAYVDSDIAMAQARALDAGPSRGPLHGVPLGIKDVIDTFDMPTQMGSPIYEGFRPAADASCVALARAAGAVILGKTITCEFAGATAADTRNPHNPAHTPGGSSSGSGAAVADFMVPAAYGTQTGGSVIRPASYCGIFGYKPTFNLVNRDGLTFAAESLDTIGFHARSVDDHALLISVLANRPLSPPDAIKAQPRIGLYRSPHWDIAQRESRAALEDAASRLSAAGATITEITPPAHFADLRIAARETINRYERAKAMAHEYAQHRDGISDKLRHTIKLGIEMRYQDYVDALKLGERCRAEFDAVMDGCDVLITPSATGEAPRGLESTGEPDFQAPWTMLHVPAMTLPTHRGPHGLPVGVQLIARRYDDDLLFACARWVADVLGTADIAAAV